MTPSAGSLTVFDWLPFLNVSAREMFRIIRDGETPTIPCTEATTTYPAVPA